MVREEEEKAPQEWRRKRGETDVLAAIARDGAAGVQESGVARHLTKTSLESILRTLLAPIATRQASFVNG
jgi:hypothetical protein